MSTHSFADFWNLYPRKVAKKDAEKAWNRLTPDQQALAVAALPAHRKNWAEPQYTPHAATWLYGERWEDQLETEEPVAIWWKTQTGIEAKAKELGMWPPRSGEGWHELKARVQARIDTTARAA